MPVRQVLSTLLEAIPVDLKANDRLASARQRLGRLKWSGLLNLDCEAVTGLLRKLEEFFQEVIQRRRQEEKKRDDEEYEREIARELLHTPSPFTTKTIAIYFLTRSPFCLNACAS
jgi:hypothetical protein